MRCALDTCLCWRGSVTCIRSGKTAICCRKVRFLHLLDQYLLYNVTQILAAHVHSGLTPSDKCLHSPLVSWCHRAGPGSENIPTTWSGSTQMLGPTAGSASVSCWEPEPAAPATALHSSERRRGRAESRWQSPAFCSLKTERWVVLDSCSIGTIHLGEYNSYTFLLNTGLILLGALWVQI